MATQSLAQSGEEREEGCGVCSGTGWVAYPSITLHERVEWAWRLCGACAISEPVRYGIECDDSRGDGEERYVVFAWLGHVKHLVTIAGSASAAERDLRRLREGEVLPHDRRLGRQAGAA